ncbi:hypothetical protein M0638_27005 [Roseomonas sp. NAR14]|uniref:Uncharacterized protein n=1 Tax=Roseomonas acroporae TaxID=2937791 RepID=A0A9X2C0D2_9PROT|nr:hypothetical protein [Roseomonas acroporae]MCK8788010.1 hypothetical protein [Roseomonas acroporae]
MSTLYQPSFAAGELAPGLHYRSDLAKWRAGAKRLVNFFVHPQGGISNRAGTQYTGTAKATAAVRLIPFTFNVDQTYALEFGAGYIRFISGGAYLTVAGAPLEVATPYAAGELFALKYVQSNDVLTITHPAHAPQTLRRLGVTTWDFGPVDFGAQLGQVTGLTATAQSDSVPGGTPTPSMRGFRYAVAAARRSPPDYGPLSADATCSNYDLGYNGTNGTRNTLHWDTLPGASFYNVYRFYQGGWGFIGATEDQTFVDTNALPDLADGPVEANDPFVDGWPATVGYYQQRQVFGGGTATPQTLNFSRSANFTSFDTANPLQPDDAITATLASRESNSIRHLIALQDLIVLTASAAWSVSGGDSGVLTAASILVKPQVFVGASDVPPLTVNFDLLYVQAKGAAVRGLAYNNVANGYVGQDLSVLSAHLFTGYTIVDWAWCAEPHKVVWAVRSDGVLLGFTFLREQEVYAWHRHETDGQFLSVCSVSEDGEDVLYCAVRRGGAITVERMRSRRIGPQGTNPAEAWFVDCGLQYRGAPATTISGLGHLEGRTVAILADGNVVTPRAVAGGTITLDRPASIVTVGLPFTALAETLPLDLGQQGGTIIGKRKRVSQVRLAVENTRGLEVAISPERAEREPQWREFKERRFEAWGAPTALLTGTEELNVAGEWDHYGSMLIRQTRPLPCTVLGIMPEVEVGS